MAPIKQTNPWEQTPSPPQPTDTGNPWAPNTPSSSTTTPTQAKLTEAEKWLAQTSQTVSPVSSLGSPQQQQVTQVQVHSGGNTPIQNGVTHNQISQQQQQGAYQQPTQQQAMEVSMNYNNANNAATVGMTIQQQPATQYQKGISGSWTNDLSRTLPVNNVNLQNVNGNQKVDNFDAKWAALDASTNGQAPNPFKNAVKTFEINL